MDKMIEKVQGTEIWATIWKEFKYPLILASLWAILTFFGNDDYSKIKNGEYIKIAISIINTLVSALFLISVFFGHYNRVKKQLTVEKNFENIASKLEHLTNDLENKTKNLFNTITGGDSYLEFAIFRDAKSKKWNLNCFHRGEYMMYDVTIIITDHFQRSMASIEQLCNEQKYGVTQMHMGNLGASTYRDFGNYKTLEGQNKIRLDISVLARNANFLSRISIIDIENPEIISAHQVLNSNTHQILKERIHPNFPKDENGETFWGWS